MPEGIGESENKAREQAQKNLYEQVLQNTKMAMLGQTIIRDSAEDELSMQVYADNSGYGYLNGRERKHMEPEIFAVSHYAEARFRNTLTVEQAKVYKNALVVYYRSLAENDALKNGPEEEERRLAQIKLDMLMNGWTPEDMVLVDVLFAKTGVRSENVRAQAEKCLEELRKIKVERVSDRARAYEPISALLEEVEKTDHFGAMFLDAQARNAFERPVLPVEYPLDEEYQRDLNDMLATVLQGETEVAGASGYLRARAEERGRNEKAQMQTRLKDDYVMPLTSAKGDEKYKTNNAQVPAWRGGISNRTAASKVFGDAAYDLIDEARKGSAQKRTVKLHHSRGNRQLMQGDHVLELDFAGTAFFQTRRDHHGLDGWNEPSYEGAGNPRLENLLRQEYGELVPGYEHIREKKTKVTLENGEEKIKSRFTVAGPNTSNTNEYAINKMRSFGATTIIDYVKPLLEDYKKMLAEGADPASLPPIHVNLTGHSRGAVTAAESLLLADQALKNDPDVADLLDYVHYDLILRDPVPGYGNRTEHAEVDLSGVKNLNCSVFYALSQEYYDWAFRPQIIKGADRIVTSAMSHSTYLDSTDLSQMAVEKDGMAHRRGVYDAETGEFYRGSGLSELPEGFFFMDDNQNLIRIDSLSQVMKLSDTMFAGKLNFGRQPQREAVIKKAMANWLATHDLKVSYFDEGQRGHIKDRTDKAAAEIYASKDPRVQKIRDAILVARELEEGANRGSKEDYGIAMKGIADACKEYMKEAAFPSNDEKLHAIVSDLLAGAQREVNYTKHGLDRLPGLEKEGVLERRLELDQQRMLAAGRVKGAVITVSTEAKELLARLGNVKHAKNDRAYDELKEALEQAARLDGKTTYNKAMEMIAKLGAAAAAYSSTRRSETFKGEKKAGKKTTGELAAQLVRTNLKELIEAGNDILYKDAGIDDLLSRAGKTVAHYQSAVRELELASLEKMKPQAPKPKAAMEGTEIKKAQPTSLKKLEEKNGYERKL